jgi:hypothetical protein
MGFGILQEIFMETYQRPLGAYKPETSNYKPGTSYHMKGTLLWVL